MFDGLTNVARARVIDPLLQLLRQGVTPTSIAASMSAGAVIGVFPLLGSTTVICLLLALALRLNLVAMQALNWLVYPLQVALILPFIEIGQRLFSDSPVELSLEQLQAAFEQGWWHAVADLWDLLLNGVLAWGLIAVPAGMVLYPVFAGVLRRVDVLALVGRRERIAGE